MSFNILDNYTSTENVLFNSNDIPVDLNSQDNLRPEYVSLATLFILIEVIIFLPTIFGNSLILISIARFKRLRSRMNILIANLAVSDLLIGCVMIPYDMCFINFSFLRNGKYTCLLRHSIEASFLGASVLNLLVISVERYLAIVKPLKHVQKATSRLLMIMIASSWTVAIVVACLPLIGWNSWTPTTPCDTSVIYPKAYNGLIVSILVGSLIANFVMYIQVVRTAFSQIKAIQNTTHVAEENTVHHIEIKKKNIKKTKLMILVLGVFAICWGPFCITMIIEILFLEPSETLELVKRFFGCLGLLNSGLNWMIFGAKNTTYRKAFKYILRCGYGMNDSSLMVSSTAA